MFLFCWIPADTKTDQRLDSTWMQSTVGRRKIVLARSLIFQQKWGEMRLAVIEFACSLWCQSYHFQDNALDWTLGPSLHTTPSPPCNLHPRCNGVNILPKEYCAESYHTRTDQFLSRASILTESSVGQTQVIIGQWDKENP